MKPACDGCLRGLRFALRDERQAVEHLREARRRVDRAIARARAQGVPYRVLARLLVTPTGDLAATEEQLRRAEARLRQRIRKLRRRDVTGDHGNRRSGASVPGKPTLRSAAKGENTMDHRNQLRRRRIVEEEYGPIDGDEGLGEYDHDFPDEGPAGIDDEPGDGDEDEA